MSDVILESVIAAGAVITGALIAGIVGFVIANRQAKTLREERRAAEEERHRIRLEEAEREERRERVKPIRARLDALAEFHSFMGATAARAKTIAQETGEPQEVIRKTLEKAPEFQRRMTESFAHFQVAISRAPPVLYIKLLEFIKLFRGTDLENLTAASLVDGAAALHDAIDEYIARGTIGGRDPTDVLSEEESARLQKAMETVLDKILEEAGLQAPPSS